MSWIKELKAGDKVIVHSWYHNTVAVVDKVTPTGRIKVGTTYFSNTGRELGADNWHASHLGEATPEVLDAILHTDTIARALHLANTAKTISYEQAVDLIAILENKDEA